MVFVNERVTLYADQVTTGGPEDTRAPSPRNRKVMASRGTPQ